MAEAESNWLHRFRNICQIDSLQFVECWQHYDKDGSGYIDGEEIDKFFADLMSVSGTGKELTDSTKEELLKEFMQEFDENRDGRIEMAELAKILPTEENFLAIFRKDNNSVSCKDFMQIWKKYATDSHDYLDASQLRDFLKTLFAMSGKQIPELKLQEYASSILCLFDVNGDSKLSFKEMSRLLPAEENVLLKFKNETTLTTTNFEEIFNHYDKDGNGTVSGDELEVFLQDLADLMGHDVKSNPEEFEKFKKMMISACDTNGDGSLQKSEMALWLGVN